MKRAIAAAALALAATTIATPTHANTTAPCVRHSAGTPYVSLVDHGVATLGGAGDIGGCPSTAGSVAVTVALQHYEGGAWVDKATADFSRAWPKAYRYARQAGGTVYATCVVGQWRTDVRGGDGFSPTEWSSAAVTFVAGDSGVCGSYGGGD